MKKKIAVVGTGIAGLSIAHFLSKENEVELFEKADYIGGHSNTVDVKEEDRKIPIDTGFIVFNHVTYPNLLKLFAELDVPTKKSDMSFSVQNEQTGLEFCGSGLNGLFAQRKNLLSLRYIRFLLEIHRFNKNSPKILDDPRYEHYTLGQYLSEEGYKPEMLTDYLIPMSSAVWSTPPDTMLNFPARTLVQFFYNHGFLGLNTQHQWYTVDGGSREYVKRLVKGLKKVHLKTPVLGVVPKGKKVEVEIKGGIKKQFDKVILATHGDISLNLLKKPSPLQKEVLSEFQFQENIATLHTWEGDMPQIQATWSSWNYKYGKPGQGYKPPKGIIPSKDGLLPYTVYWMNKLQGVSKKKNYFVTINDPGRIPDEHVIRRISYTHPLFSVGAVKAQARFSELNSEGNIHFTGAFFRYGFHEDGIHMSVKLFEQLSGKSPWA